MASPSLTLPAETAARGLDSAAAWRSGLLSTWLLLLVVTGPLFVCMPLTSDVVLYDLQARNLLNGGVAYRDIFETNLPGMIWVHVVVRSIIGDSSVAMRCVDLMVVGGVILLLLRGLRTIGVAANTRLAAGLVMTLFYLSTNEWCHCQRDVWMMIPVLLACGLRCRAGVGSKRRTWASSAAEGLLWGIAFWMKPFTAVPGLFCILASWLFAIRGRRAILTDAAGVFAGGALAGACGTVWLWHSGAWPYFWETMTEWNSEYLAAGKSRWTLERLIGMVERFQPWILLHFISVPVAVHSVFVAARRAVLRRDLDERTIRFGLLAVLYLAWLLQSFAFQHLMDYIHVPAIILAIAIVTPRWQQAPRFAQGTAAVLLVLAVLAAPLLRPARVSQWNTCLRQGSTPEVRVALSSFPFPQYDHMQRVIGFLKSQNPSDGEVTCYNVHSIHVYDELQLRPSTRYLSLQSLFGLFPGHRAEIAETLALSPQRYVVTELTESRRARADEFSVPTPEQCVFPWSYPVVFRSGSYLVHRVDRPFDKMTGSLSAIVEADLSEAE